MNGIYIITGIMASGKSTVAQLLAERASKSVHIRGDIYRKMIVNGREEMKVGASDEALTQLYLRYRLAAHSADEYFRAGFTVFLQDCYLGKETMKLLNAIRSRPIHLITLTPSVEAVMQREEGRNKTGYRTFEIAALHEVLMTENPRMGLWLDTSDMTAEETADEILHRASESRIFCR